MNDERLIERLITIAADCDEPEVLLALRWLRPDLCQSEIETRLLILHDRRIELDRLDGVIGKADEFYRLTDEYQAALTDLAVRPDDLTALVDAVQSPMPKLRSV